MTAPSVVVAGDALVLTLLVLMRMLPGQRQGLLSIRACRECLYLQQFDISVPAIGTAQLLL